MGHSTLTGPAGNFWASAAAARRMPGAASADRICSACLDTAWSMPSWSLVSWITPRAWPR